MRISHTLLTLVLTLAPFSASAAAYIKFDGVDGEVKASSSASSTSGAKGGNVEFEWKVEEGESMEPGSDDLPVRAATSSSSSAEQAGSKDHKNWIDVNSVTDDREDDSRDVSSSDDDSADESSGTSRSSSSASSPSNVRGTDNDPQEGSVDYLLEIDGVEGESQEAPAPGVEPDEIDVALDGKLMTNFGILLGGSGDGGDTSAAGGEGKPGGEGDGTETENPAATIIEEILMDGMEEEGAPMETISLNYEKIKTTSKQKVKLLGFIPITVTATVEIDNEDNVKVKYPWWTFIASGKDGDTLGQNTFAALSNVTKAKHDMMMTAIKNMK